ncbi:hypothetical protein [Massilia sp. CF038]|uniref:hypothetical protein n=1 Tax=Massilia sp. CF038 TaxID=1881045 RepID=UPI000918EF88|nr:hypothetical protein [Massilia sp. CF038]SHH60093.1 hypothetical protein SAMN05428948_4555 [Massilia sp. CF038]
MTTDLDSRRSIRTISRADFAGFPVWEWALNEEATLGQNESFVRPTALAAIALEQPCQLVVAATFTLSNGACLPGCVELDIRARKVRAVPMFLLLQDRHLELGDEQTLSTLAHFTKVADVRPVAWELAVPVAGQSGPLRGSIRRSLRSRIASLWRRSPSQVASILG